MTQQVNTNYARYLRKGRYKPVYLILFDGIPMRFSTGPVAQKLGPTTACVKQLTGGAATVTVTEGRSSLASCTLEILDLNLIVTQTAATYQLGNRKVTVMAGFQGLPEANYVNAYVGRVNNYTLESDNVTWSFDLVALFTDTFSNIFDQSAYVEGAVGTGDTTITVDSTIGWPSATNGNNYLLINQEVISYTSIDATHFTGCARGQLGTTATTHEINDTISGFYVLQGNPFDIALQILTSTGNGTNGPYDVLPANAGLAIDQSLVDIAGYETERDNWLSGWVFRFEEYRSVVGKQFLEQQIYTFCNAYPVLNNQGQLSIKVYTPPLPNQQAPALTDLQLAEPPTFQGNVFSQNFYNEVQFTWDYDFLEDLTGVLNYSSSGPYDSVAYFEDETSQNIFGVATTETWISRGVRTAYLGLPQIQQIAQNFLKRFAVPSPIITAKVFYETRLLEQGDIVPLSSAKLPNLGTGKLGVQDRLMEIIGITPDYMNGVQTLMLLDTGVSYGKKYAAISPSAQSPINFPNYLSANNAQRNYAFISTSAGLMSDGSSGYFITQ